MHQEPGVVLSQNRRRFRISAMRFNHVNGDLFAQASKASTPRENRPRDLIFFMFISVGAPRAISGHKLRIPRNLLILNNRGVPNRKPLPAFMLRVN